MSKIFDADSDSDIEIKTNNEYAKNYEFWRKKEELNKLKNKYGDNNINLTIEDDEETSSSEDDEEGVELTEKVEQNFYKTLSYLKNKDPRIYDENIKFFDNNDEHYEKEKQKKDKPMYIKDYERNIILEKNGQLSDEENGENKRTASPTYVQEQEQLKQNVKKALNNINEDGDDDNWGGIFKIRQKSKEAQIKEEEDYKEWLQGHRNEIKNKEMENELKPLKDYWNNPNLEEDEKFLCDYILNKRFLNKENDDYIPTYNEIVDSDLSEDEKIIEKQEEFEHKYNFRFEEPDQEFIKRYPRTMEQSVRKTDDKRKIKRSDRKERKQKEKQEKMEELKKLRELKMKEIDDKIQKLKEITGNTDIAFKEDDINGDFDPEAHDKRMEALFNDDFYEGPEENEKPAFPEIDEYLEIDDWHKYENDEKEDYPHCEDEDFNMDCDYDPQAPLQQHEENGKNRKKRKRKSLFAKIASQSKPIFDPNEKTYDEYMDEYYKLDCEDFIGDLPCRFKYRKVVPNNFGLSLEEILLADDQELNKWCSLKKMVKHRPDHIEKYEQMAYEKKAKNADLKKKILPSLFKPSENKIEKNEKKKNKKISTQNKIIINNEEKPENLPSDEQVENLSSKKRDDTLEKNFIEINSDKAISNKFVNKNETLNIKIPAKNNLKKKKKANKNINVDQVDKQKRKRKFSENSQNDKSSNSKNKKKKKNKNKSTSDVNVGMSDARLSAYGFNPKKFKNKLKYGKT